MKLQNSNGRVNTRRSSALKRLEHQLNSNVKIDKETKEKVELSESDVKRIKNEINILNSKITSDEVARATRTKIKRGIYK